MSSLLEACQDLPLIPAMQKPYPVPMTIILGIIAELRAAGFVAGIAGGCARDLYYGATPKDVDVVITHPDGLDDSEFFEKANELAKKLSSLGYQSDMHEAYMQHEESPTFKPDERLSCVLTSQGADFIFYEFGECLSDITDEFDFNVNQFALNDKGIPVYLGQHPHPDQELVSIRSVLPERADYIYRKHKELLKCLAKKQA